MHSIIAFLMWCLFARLRLILIVYSVDVFPKAEWCPKFGHIPIVAIVVVYNCINVASERYDAACDSKHT